MSTAGEQLGLLDAHALGRTSLGFRVLRAHLVLKMLCIMNLIWKKYKSVS